MLNLDTHILLHGLDGSLRPAESEVLKDRWGISAIVLWEIAKLSALGRIDITLDHAGFRRALSRIQIWPVSLEVCSALGRLDFNSDPADELIAATSLVYGAPLVTRDRKLRRSRVVPLAGE